MLHMCRIDVNGLFERSILSLDFNFALPNVILLHLEASLDLDLTYGIIFSGIPNGVSFCCFVTPLLK